MKANRSLLLALLILLSPALVMAQDKPAPTPAPEPLTAKVISTVGDVDYLAAGLDENKEENWRAIKADDIVMEGAQITTYDRANVYLRFGENTLITIFQNSIVHVDQSYLAAAKNTVVTDLRLVTGSVKVEIDKTTTKTDMHISTPNATASVTGTITTVGTHGGFGDQIGVARGHVRVHNGRGGQRNVGAGERTTNNCETTLQTTLEDTRTDSTPEGTTAAESLAAISGSGATTGTLPGDTNGDSSPATARILDQQGNVNTGGEDSHIGHTEPPPDQPNH